MKWNRLAVASVVALAFASPLLLIAEDAATDAPKMTIKEVMGKTFKGDTAMVKTVLSGKADEATVKQFIANAHALAANKPKKGEEAAWKERTQSIIDAAQGLLDKKDGSLDSLKKATNCATCHNAFK